MAVKDILTALTECGAAVSVENDQLVIKTRSELPQSLLEAIRENKQELIAYLRRQNDPVWLLYPSLGKEIRTKSGVRGRLLQVFGGQVAIHPAGGAKVVYAKPEEVILRELVPDG